MDGMGTRQQQLGALRTSGMYRRRTIFPSIPPSSETIVKSGYYDEILSTIPCMVIEFDPSGRLTFLNDTGREVLGYSPTDIEGQRGLFFAAEPDRARLKAVLSSALKGNDTEPVEFRARCSDGYEIAMRLACAIIENGKNIIGLRAVAFDITEEMRAKAMLVERERYLEMVLSNAPVVLWVTDGQGVMRYLNGKGLAPGLVREKLLGMSAFDILPDNMESKRNLERALAGEEFTGIIEGAGFVHRVIYNPLIEHATGRQEGIIGVSVDITEVVGAHRKLQEEEGLKNAGEAAAKAGHDINNSLSVPLCNLQYMQDMDFSALGPQKAAEMREMLDESLDALARCQRLVRDMMSLSKGSQMRKVTIELNSVLSSVVREARKESSVMKVAVDFSPSAEKCRLMGDQDMIFRALQNVVKNAVEASPEGSRVSVGVEVEKKEDSMVARISVRDSGPGMPPHVLESIFRPFFTTKGGGNGLGLSISWSHIKAHGGTISVESTEGLGSAFTITLPLIHSV